MPTIPEGKKYRVIGAEDGVTTGGPAAAVRAAAIVARDRRAGEGQDARGKADRAVKADPEGRGIVGAAARGGMTAAGEALEGIAGAGLGVINLSRASSCRRSTPRSFLPERSWIRWPSRSG